MNTSLSPTNKGWLGYATKKLKVAGIDSASLDAIIILCFCLKLTKINVLSNPYNKLSKNQLKLAEKLLDLREKNYPIAYITNKIEFYNRSFYVDKRVLIPRPESESFINLLKSENISNLQHLTDLGCGSGILGITANLEFPHINIELLDKSRYALKVTNINLSNFKIQAEVKLSNLLSSSNHKFDIILANLPYVPENMTVSEAILFEPKLAVFAGTDGLNLYKKMIAQLKKSNHKPKFILIECLNHQKPILKDLFNEISYKPIKSEGLVHMFVYDTMTTHHQL